MILEYPPIELRYGAEALRQALREFIAASAPTVFSWTCPTCKHSGRAVVFLGDDLPTEVQHQHLRLELRKLQGYQPCQAPLDEIRVQRWTASS